MTADVQPAQASKAARWTGYVIVAVLAALLTFSAVMKFIKTPEVVKGFTDLGWPDNLALALGITELTCVVLYAIPQTAVLGAILLTGYMGGAIATHLRIGENFYIQAGIGVLVWLGIFLRDRRLRKLLPLRR